MFVTSWCPYCHQAISMMQQLKNINSEYASIPINIIDEELEPQIAQNYNYYYVPTYFIGDTKLHEGAVTNDVLINILNRALE